MADPQKLVKVDDAIVSFPGDMEDTGVANAIKVFRARKKFAPIQTEESEHARQLKPSNPISSATDPIQKVFERATAPIADVAVTPYDPEHPVSSTWHGLNDRMQNIEQAPANFIGATLRGGAGLVTFPFSALKAAYQVVSGTNLPEGMDTLQGLTIDLPYNIYKQYENDYQTLGPVASLSRLAGTIYSLRAAGKLGGKAVEKVAPYIPQVQVNPEVGYTTDPVTGAKMPVNLRGALVGGKGYAAGFAKGEGGQWQGAARVGPFNLKAKDGGVKEPAPSTPSEAGPGRLPEAPIGVTPVPVTANLKRGVPAAPKPVGKPLSVDEVKALAEQVKGVKAPVVPATPQSLELSLSEDENRLWKRFKTAYPNADLGETLQIADATRKVSGEPKRTLTHLAEALQYGGVEGLKQTIERGKNSQPDKYGRNWDKNVGDRAAQILSEHQKETGTQTQPQAPAQPAPVQPPAPIQAPAAAPVQAQPTPAAPTQAVQTSAQVTSPDVKRPSYAEPDLTTAEVVFSAHPHPTNLYRGTNGEQELQDILSSKAIKSTTETATRLDKPQHAGMTFFSDHPNVATSYVHDGGYVLEVDKSKVPEASGHGAGEIATSQPTPLEAVKRIFKVGKDATGYHSTDVTSQFLPAKGTPAVTPVEPQVQPSGEGVVPPEQLAEAHKEIERIADEHGDHYPYEITDGEQLPRVVWGAKKGQTLKTKSADRVGIKTPNKGVYGLHVGDPDYWKTRLAKDYDQDEGGAQNIIIRANAGDRVVDDPQYATDPDTGEKSDSGVLLTARKELQYGKDWVFDGEEFTDNGKSGVVPVEPTANLTQQTETPEFKQWFGDWQDPHAWSSKRDPNKPSVSMAVKNGKPMVLYHATAGDFDQFEVGRKSYNSNVFGPYETNRHGIFLAEDPSFAGEFVIDAESPNSKPKKGGKTLPVYVNIKSPLDLREGKSTLDQETLDEFKEHGVNPRWILNGTQHTWELFDDDDGKEFVRAAQEIGYDGAIITDDSQGDAKNTDTWVAFKPEQIKSATGNKGTFNPLSADITVNLVYKAPTATSEPAIADAYRNQGDVWTEMGRIGFTPPADSAGAKEWGDKIAPLLEKFQAAQANTEALEKGIGEVHDLANGARVLFLRRAGLRSLHIGYTGGNVRPGSTLNGVTFTKDQLRYVLDNLDMQNPPHAKELKAALLQAMDPKTGDVTVSTPREPGMSRREWLSILYEELFHTAESKFPLADEQWMEMNKAIPRALNAQLVYNYPNMEDNNTAPRARMRVREAVAHLASGGPEQNNLSPEEFGAFWFQYLDALIKTHGTEAVDKLAGLSAEARKGREEFKNARGIGAGPQTSGAGNQGDSGSVQERGPEGAGGVGPEAGRGISQVSGGGDGQDRQGGDAEAATEPAKPAVEPQASLKTPEPTETPEFKAWFGKSKVVDEKGKPLVLYHGTTRKNPKILRQSFEAGTGIFLTDSEDVASTFTLPREWGETVFEDEEGNEIEPGDVVPIYARIEKPLVITGREAQNVSDDTALQTRTLKAAKAKGHDGVILREIKEGIGESHRSDTYIVFDPKQVKSATNNKGTYGLTNPDITANLKQNPPNLEVIKAWGALLNPKNVRVKDPNGMVHIFGDEESAAKFRTAAGIQ
jgi:hypothetical protein